MPAKVVRTNRIFWWWMRRADLWYFIYKCAQYIHRVPTSLARLDCLLQEREECSPDNSPHAYAEQVDDHETTIRTGIFYRHQEFDPSPVSSTPCPNCGNQFWKNGQKTPLTAISTNDDKDTTLLNWRIDKQSLVHRSAHMYLNPLMSDVIFVVGEKEKEEILAHKYVLATGSEVFHKMFYGGLAEHGKVINIPDVNPVAFKTLLRYLYCDQIDLNAETVLECLYASEKYEVFNVSKCAVRFLERNLCVTNACVVLVSALHYGFEDLANQCCEVIDAQTHLALRSEDFTQIDLATLRLILLRETLTCKEFELHSACSAWARAECLRKDLKPTARNKRKVLGVCPRLIRYTCMSNKELAEAMTRDHLLEPEDCMRVFLYLVASEKPHLPFATNLRTGLIEKVCYRFRACARHKKQWRYRGRRDAVEFSVSKRIFLIGLGLYGSSANPCNYSAQIEVRQEEGRLAYKWQSYFTDGSTKTFRVQFTEPIQIDPGMSYTVSATGEGSELSYFGQSGSSVVQVDAVTFHFRCSTDSTNGTSVHGGQIPELLFYG